MTIHKSLFSIVFGVGIGVLAYPMYAQQSFGGDADVPESASEVASQRPVGQKWKGFAPIPSSANVFPSSARRQESGHEQPQRRGTQRQLNGQTFRSTKLIGTEITNAQGQAIGKVVDFVTDAQGNILYPLVSYSGSPGFSGKLFAVPYGSLRFGTGPANRSTAQLSFDPQLLQNAPNFASSNFPEFSDPALQNRLNAYYQSGNSTSAPGSPTITTGNTGAMANPVLPLTGNRSNIVGVNATAGNSTISATGAAFPSAAITGPTGSPAGSSVPTQSVIGSSGSPAGSSIIGPGGSPAGSSVPGGSIVGPTGAPGGTSLPPTTANGSTVVSGSSATGTSASPPDATPTSSSVISATGSPASGTTSTAASVSGNDALMIRSSQLAGMPIQDSNGNVTGKVVDFVTDANGNGRYAVVTMSGDSRNIIVPTSAVNLRANGTGSNFATLRLASPNLQNAPGFTGNTWPSFTNPQFINDINAFYQQSPSVFNNYPAVPTIGTPATLGPSPSVNTANSSSLFPEQNTRQPASSVTGANQNNSGQLFPRSQTAAPATGGTSPAVSQPSNGGTSGTVPRR